MRILHTSDWHLGRTLHGENLHEHHRAFHEFLVQTVRERQIDVVVVAGDVYDRSVAPVESIELLDHTLTRLAELTTVIMTPGNHDSAVRLGFGAGLMRDGVHVLSSMDGIERPVSVADEHGEVLFFGLPFLDPDVARYSLVERGAKPLPRSHMSVTEAAMTRVRAKLDALGNPRSVVLAHTFLSGGEPSESERDLTVGGVDSVPGSVFEGVDYVALGHLHGCQNMSALIPGDRPVAWYSGSPLAFSFSERHHKKAVLEVEISVDSAPSVTRIPTPVPRRLVSLSGTLAEVMAKSAEHGKDWVRAVIREDARPPHLQQTLRAHFPHLLLTEFESTRELASTKAPVVTKAAAPSEVIDNFYEFLTGAPLSDDYRELVEDVLADARMAASEAGKAAKRA